MSYTSKEETAASLNVLWRLVEELARRVRTLEMKLDGSYRDANISESGKVSSEASESR